MQDKDLENLYEEYWTFHAAMIDKGYTALEIAAVLVAQSMSIYKTVLDEEQYNMMVDSISDMRYNVKELKPDQGKYH